MTRGTRPAPEQFDDEARVIGADGLVRSVPGYAPTERIAQQIDGVEAIQTVDPVPRYSVGLVTHLPMLDVDALTVACIGLSRLLERMQFFAVNLEARLADRLDIQARAFTFVEVTYDYPRIEDEDKVPIAVIEQGSEVAFESNGETPYLLEGTADVYYPGTVLRSIGIASCDLIVTAVLGHKDERRAVRSCFETMLLAEPGSEKHGRRVVVPENFDRSVRYQLLGAPIPPQDPQNNRWVYQARVLAEVERVHLVASPETLERPKTRVQI